MWLHIFRRRGGRGSGRCRGGGSAVYRLPGGRGIRTAADTAGGVHNIVVGVFDEATYRRSLALRDAKRRCLVMSPSEGMATMGVQGGLPLTRAARRRATARRAAERAATDAPADAGTEELGGASPVVDAATGVATATAGPATDNAPTAEVARLSQTPQVSLSAQLLRALYLVVGNVAPEFITSLNPLVNWAFIPGKHSSSSDESSNGDDDGKRNRRA